MSPYPFDLGPHSLRITTSSADAQRWFDRGLNWYYAFNREEARRCFEHAIDADPACAMAHWGLAHATGPYYNQTWELMTPTMRPDINRRMFEHLADASERAPASTPMEQAIIAAASQRCPAPANDDPDVYVAWNDAYADAMAAVAADFGEDDDVCALAVESLICRTPWQLWDLERAEPAEGASTAEAIELLDMALTRASAQARPPHPGLLHFKIHIMEMSPYPESALAEADVLRGLIPDAAHLVHMPSHLYVLCGRFEDSLDSNVEAVVGDRKYVDVHPEVGLYTIYMLHNLHFQMYSAMFLGRYEAALRAGDEMWEAVTPEMLRDEDQFIVNYLEGFYGMRVHVEIRFGQWQKIIDEPMPEEPDLFCVTTALWHYAKGVAHAALGHVEAAEQQQEMFTAACERVPEERRVFNNESREVLTVAEAMLSGEIEYRRGDFDRAFAELRRCVDLYDRLNYTEPWAWMQPPRHALGALLLEQGRVDEAAAVYRADLGLDDTLIRASQHPGNVWALHGYHECLELLGRHDEATRVEAELVAARAGADVTVSSSCFCRGSA